MVVIISVAAYIDISNVATYIDGFGILFGLAGIGLQLWLLLAPGQPEDN